MKWVVSFSILRPFGPSAQVKLSTGGLFILNPIAATRELLDMVHELEKQHGPVKHVVLSTVAIEHKAYAAVWTSKFNLCFNSGFVGVWVRCYSPYSVGTEFELVDFHTGPPATVTQ